MFTQRPNTEPSRGWNRWARFALLLLLALFPLVPANRAAASVNEAGIAVPQARHDVADARTHELDVVTDDMAQMPSSKVIAQASATKEYRGTAKIGTIKTESIQSTSNPPVFHEQHTSTRLANGHVLIVGKGIDGGASEALFDPATRTFTSIGKLNQPRVAHTATLLNNGMVLIAGGYDIGVRGSVELYNPTTRTFSSIGSLHRSRYLHTATLLKDGKVLIVGGSSDTRQNEPIAEAELYDPATGTFTLIANMITARSYHSTTLLPNGLVLVAGGNDGYETTTGAEIYNPTTGRWTRTRSFQQPHLYHAATLLPNGKVLITGTSYNRTPTNAELYDPATGTFHTTGVHLANRTAHTATLLANGTVLILGGWYDRNGWVPILVRTAEIYDPRTGSFTATDSPEEPRTDHTATLMANGEVLVHGGYGANGRVGTEIFSPSSGMFKPINPMLQSRTGHTATLLPNGNVLIAGGHEDASYVDTKLYNATTKAFTPTGNLIQNRSGHTATLLPNGNVLIAGGSNGSALNSAEVYAPASGTFTRIGSLRQARTRHTATLLQDGTVLFVGGRDNAGKVISTAEIYDPATGVFRYTGNLRQRRAAHSATVLQDGTVLVAGGANEYASSIRDAERYNPATGTWTRTANMYYERSGFTATLLRDGNVLIAGGIDPFGTHAEYNEIYHSSTGVFRVTEGLKQRRSHHAATLLNDGQVLVTGGLGAGNVTEVYNPGADAWRDTGTLARSRVEHTATLLGNGSVLIEGGATPTSELTSFVVDNVFTGTLTVPVWAMTATPTVTFTGSTTRARLSAGSISDEYSWIPAAPNVAVTATLSPLWDGVNHPLTLHLRDINDKQTIVVRGTINVDTSAPQSWMTGLPATSPAVTTLRYNAGDSASGVASYDIDVRDGEAGTWRALRRSIATTSTTFQGQHGHTYFFRVRARDRVGHVEAWRGTYDAKTTVNTTAPQSTMTPLPQLSRATIMLGWSGSDTAGGIKSYDLDVRDGEGGTWTRYLTSTSTISTTFTGKHGHTYFFRVRATNKVGNVEAWPTTYDTTTTIDASAPSNVFLINRGALATTSRTVTLTHSGSDTQSGIKDMRIAQDGTFGAWQPYTRTPKVTLTGASGDKTITVQVRDLVGNVSMRVTQSIRLDIAAGTAYGVTIKGGAQWTNTPTVTLRIGAQEGTSQMRIANNSTFTNADWQPFNTRPTSIISTSNDYTSPRIVYVQVRDKDGIDQAIVQDAIMYDPLRPTGAIAITSVTTTTVNVRLNATDQVNLSGVKEMRVSNNAHFTGATWQPYQSTKSVARGTGSPVNVYAQFRDGAGNRSAVVSATRTTQ